MFQMQGFRLGGAVQTKAAAARNNKEQAAAAVDKTLLSIDYTSKGF